MVYHVVYAFAAVIKGQHWRNDDAPGLRRKAHIAQVDPAERHFARHQDHLAALLDAYVRRADQQRVGITVCDGRERFHTARRDDHAVGIKRSAGYRRRQILRQIADIGQCFRRRAVHAQLKTEVRVCIAAHNQMGLHIRDLSQQRQKPDADLHAVCGADTNDDLLHVRTQAPFFPAGTAAHPCT